MTAISGSMGMAVALSVSGQEGEERCFIRPKTVRFRSMELRWIISPSAQAPGILSCSPVWEKDSRASAALPFRVHVFGRKRVLPPVYSTKEIAEDVFTAMRHLGIEKASVIGISMGGMIAQHLAAEHPEAVKKLSLVVTCAKNNETLNTAVTRWMELAKAGDHKELMLDNARKMYTESYLRKNLWMYRLLGSFGKPRSYDRFLTMAEACLTHDACDSLEKITAPTLVIGGEKDICLSGEASVEIAKMLPNAQLYLYPDYGHALYEEAADFNDRLLEFFDKP